MKKNRLDYEAVLDVLEPPAVASPEPAGEQARAR
jgi:hypothetical protein